MERENNKFEVVIIGGGVSGTALLYVLSHFTDIDNIALVEKYPDFAVVNSHYNNNSQTLHFGDIETNYTLEKARAVKEAADLVKKYVEKHVGEKLFYKSYKMALAVGDDEVVELEKRYQEFLSLFPKLKRLEKEEIGAIEPLIVQGRESTEKLLALYSEDGYAINYQSLAKSLATEAQKTSKNIQIYLNTKVSAIKKQGDDYRIYFNNSYFDASYVVFAAGAHSLLFAKTLGYGKDLGILPVAGNFYRGANLLKGKVYTMQDRKLPFAAVHGDASVDNPSETRFGPTAKVLPLLERRNNKTFKDFLKVSVFSLDGVLTIFNILSDSTIFKYILKNSLYDLPIIGKRLFIQNVRKIIPTITNRQICFGKGLGGVRPQLVNMKTRKMEMGEAKIVGEKIIFNITPSPGASVCLKNAERDAKMIAESLGKQFNEEKFQLEFS